PREDPAPLLPGLSAIYASSVPGRGPPGPARTGGAAAQLQDQSQVAALRLPGGVASGLGVLPAHQRRPARGGRDARRLHERQRPTAGRAGEPPRAHVRSPRGRLLLWSDRSTAHRRRDRAGGTPYRARGRDELPSPAAPPPVLAERFAAARRP